jgi:hypothetical protein
LLTESPMSAARHPLAQIRDDRKLFQNIGKRILKEKI